jgi:mitosis inhibitor protein kinase SWE1
MMNDDFAEASSPIEDSPTPACGVASATARLRLVDDESPIRRVPGQSRSLKPGPDGAGLFGTGEKRRQPSSPLKHVSPCSGMDMDDSSNTPPTPTALVGASIPQPLFSAARQTQKADGNLFAGRLQESRLPRLSNPPPARARSGTTIEAEHRPTLGGKKAISLDRIAVPDDDEPFGSPFGNPTPATGRKLRLSHGSIGSTSTYRAHKRINSGDQNCLMAGASISRSQGLKSGLALNLSPNSLKLPDFGSSNSSLSSLSTNNLTPPISAFSPAEPPIFEDLKPLHEEVYVAEQVTVGHKFKPRDSGVSMGDDDDSKPTLQPPMSLAKLAPRPRRPAMLKRTSSAGTERPRDNPLETPLDGPGASSGWPTGGNFQFVGENGEEMSMRLGGLVDDKPVMPGTPVKKQAYTSQHPRIGHSNSQPTLVVDWPESGPSKLDIKRDRKSAPSAFMPPPSTKKPSAKCIPQLTLTATSPDSPSDGMETDLSSPTVRLSSHGGSTLGPIAEAPPSRVGMLRRLSSGVGSSDGSISEDEGTPTKHGGDKHVLAGFQAASVARTPTPKTNLGAAVRSAKPIMPRMSLPAVAPTRNNRTLHHRQSHPATSTHVHDEEEDIFQQRFITLEEIGKGAFSTVMKVQERYGEGIYAVKKARGVFDGVRDRSVQLYYVAAAQLTSRLRHLEEVDILRHLSVQPHPHVIKFEDAWEQNRQLFIQTELCLGSLAFFLLEYGSVVERLDEARVWKIVRELSDVSHQDRRRGEDGADSTGNSPHSLQRCGTFRHQARKHPHYLFGYAQDR